MFRKAREAKIGGKFLAYGYEGSGKSWFALTFPKVACIDSETGIAHYEGKDITLANGKTYKVTSIAANAFKGNKKMTSVLIGGNVKKIGRSAFENCKNLTKVTVNGSKLQTISKNAFKGDKKLKNISLKKVKSLKKVEKAAFKGVSKKVTVKVPKNKKKAYSKLLAKGGIAAGKVRS